MTEKMTKHRLFWVWEFEKEEKWLNEMAADGWALAEVGFCRFTFEKCEPAAYTVRLEMHGADDNYTAFMEETGAEYIGRVLQWIYFRKKNELGQFEIFSDIDSRINHLKKICKLLLILGLMNLFLGVVNSFNPAMNVGWLNLLIATMLMYGLGRIKGKIEYLENERQLRE